MRTLNLFMAAALFCGTAAAAKAGQSSGVSAKIMKALHLDKTEKATDPKAAAGAPAPAAQVAAATAAPAAAAAAAPAEAAPAAQQDAKTSKLVSLHKVTKEEIGRSATCPVSGAKVTVAADTPALDLKGKTYYFSSSAMREKFGKDPGKYLAAKAKGLFKKKK